MVTTAIAHLDEIERILDDTYGPRKLTPNGDPVAELVGTILSQNTSDTNTARAFASLRARFPTWDAVVDADTDEVIDAIRSGGLANRKAPRIQEALAEIQDRYGSFSLDVLRDLPLDDAKQALVSIDGVGPENGGMRAAVRARSAGNAGRYPCLSRGASAWPDRRADQSGARACDT